MINRVIIRIKVLQIVYAYYQKQSENSKSAENELMLSLQKSYDLYHYLLLLIILVTDAEQRRLDIKKNKFLASDEERNPNMRLANNRFAEQVRVNETLESFVNTHGFFWNNDDSNLVKKLLTEILDSDLYQEYLTSDDSYESDREFWRKVFKTIILPNESVSEMLEDTGIYWLDDLDIVGTFVMKTIKRFEPENGAAQELMPMFKNDEEQEYAVQLLRKAIQEHEESSALIDKQIKNWDLDRIAQMDLYIMEIALAEIKNFPSIPVSVSLNEYIDLARYYSTPKSSVFINGILDAIVNELKSSGQLFKS